MIERQKLYPHANFRKNWGILFWDIAVWKVRGHPRYKVSAYESRLFRTLTSLDMGWTNDFQNSYKKSFRAILKAIFALFRLLIIFKITSFSVSLCRKFHFFMTKSEIIRVFPHSTSRGLVDKIGDYNESGQAFDSRAPTAFYFSTWKYYTIWIKFLDFLRSLDRSKVLIGVIISEF